MYLVTRKLPKHPMALELYAAMLAHTYNSTMEKYLKLRISSLSGGCHWDYIKIDITEKSVYTSDYRGVMQKEIEPEHLLAAINLQSIEL